MFMGLFFVYVEREKDLRTSFVAYKSKENEYKELNCITSKHPEK